MVFGLTKFYVIQTIYPALCVQAVSENSLAYRRNLQRTCAANPGTFSPRRAKMRNWHSVSVVRIYFEFFFFLGGLGEVIRKVWNANLFAAYL